MKLKPSCLMDHQDPGHWQENNPRYYLNYKNYATLGELTFCYVALLTAVTMAAIFPKILPGLYNFATTRDCSVVLLVHA